jgi:uncharacterized protein
MKARTIMATLKQTLQADLTTNLKARNELEITTLRSVIGAIQTQEKSGKTAVEFDDAQVLAFIAKEVKKRRDTAAIWTEAAQTERATRETAEADLLATYLPTQLTTEEVEAVITRVLAGFEAPTMRDFGQIMKTVTAETQGTADGKFVSEFVRKALG